MTMDLGFNLKNAVRTEFNLSRAGYSSVAADRFQRQLLQRSRGCREWKQQATRVPRRSPATDGLLLFFPNELPTSDLQKKPSIPITTKSRLDI